MNRQASIQSPVEKDDLRITSPKAFEKYPENETDRHKHILGFWHRLESVDKIRAKMPDRKSG